MKKNDFYPEIIFTINFSELNIAERDNAADWEFESELHSSLWGNSWEIVYASMFMNQIERKVLFKSNFEESWKTFAYFPHD